MTWLALLLLATFPPWNPTCPVVTRDIGWPEVYSSGCWGGPARGVGAAPCRWLDIDGSRTVDMRDYSHWIAKLADLP